VCFYACLYVCVYVCVCACVYALLYVGTRKIRAIFLQYSSRGAFEKERHIQTKKSYIYTYVNIHIRLRKKVCRHIRAISIQGSSSEASKERNATRCIVANNMVGGRVFCSIQKHAHQTFFFQSGICSRVSRTTIFFCIAKASCCLPFSIRSIHVMMLLLNFTHTATHTATHTTFY